MLAEAADDEERARLLGAGDKISGAWLHVPPISSVGLRMDDSCLRIAVGLCALALPSVLHTFAKTVVLRCPHRVYMASAAGGSAYDIIHRSLSAAGVSPRLQPPTLRPPTNQAHVEEIKCEKYSHLVLTIFFSLW